MNLPRLLTAVLEEVRVELPELRYRDCPTVEVTLTVAASPEAVWALVSDIQLPARFSSEFLGAEWIDGAGGPTVGARFVGRNHHAAIGDWETTSTICDYVPGRRFGWAVGNVDHPSATWRFILEPDGAGTRLTQWMQMGPARSGINLAIDAMPDKESKILHRRLGEHRANMEATLAGIKRVLEDDE
jgi:Polyketide cyclase / dehydrase and lipid transport